MRVRWIFVCLTVVSLAGVACRSSAPPAAAVAVALPADPCGLALAPVAAGPLAGEIAAQQRRASEPRGGDEALEQLGYFFVTRARLSHDEALNEAALATASCLERRNPSNDQGRLLRGHVRHQQHRFAEAEAIARTLVASRGLAIDFALLGDALMEQGKLAEAGDAYQRMIDLKPYYQSYTRAAHLRWLRGHLDGAIDLMRKAVASASPRDPEAGPWARTRLADYYLQSGRLDLARAAGLDAEAGSVEASLVREGALRDPRTLALYLATRGESPGRAIDLARRELGVRGDVFTHDALAWALARAGRLDEAAPHMAQALAEGTADARLFLHGGLIAAGTGDTAGARRLLTRAQALSGALMPSERALLAEARGAHPRLAGDGPRRLQERTRS